MKDMELLRIKNDVLEVAIDPVGAQLRSVKDKSGTEYMWHADPEVWGKSAPVLFPICGTLKDGKYILEGKEYELMPHGFAKQMDFMVREHGDDYIKLYITDTEETRAMYPYSFDLEVVFKLIGNSVKAEYNVTNKSSGRMYYSVGCHEAYACPGGVEEYCVDFGKEIDVDTCLLCGRVLSRDTMRIAEKCRYLDIKEEYFDLDSLILKDMGTHTVTLVHKNSPRRVKVDFPGFDYFLIWHVPGSEFLCLEPWKGFPDYVDGNYDFACKEGIMTIEAGETGKNEHTMTFWNE